MKYIPCLLVMLVVGCNKPTVEPSTTSTTPTLNDARKGFQTKIVRSGPSAGPADRPPPNRFTLISYPSKPGNLAAYLTPDPKDGKKHPAIIWITGGDCNSIGEVWDDVPASNDQTAGQYRKSGIVMMFPSLRGGNNNPGTKEGFFGEVDDVIASLDYLSKIDYVDPTRIYLGGHSTGGTLVLLTSECTDRFRAVFSFGPVNLVSSYPAEFIPFNAANNEESRLRSPIHWLHCIASPTFVIEGTDGNIEDLNEMRRRSKNPKTQFFEVRGKTHFNILAPINAMIAKKILKDDGSTCNITISEVEVNAAR